MLREVNRVVQPWKPAHQHIFSAAPPRNSLNYSACFYFFFFSNLIPLLSWYESPSVGRWGGTVNQYASPGSRDRLLRFLSLKTSILFFPPPPIENILFSSCLKPQSIRFIISFQKFESCLKWFASQHRASPNCCIFK